MIVLKHCRILVLLFNAYMMVLMKHKILVLFNHRSIIVILLFPQQIMFINGLGNKVLGVMFAYLGCEGGESFNFRIMFAT